MPVEQTGCGMSFTMTSDFAFHPMQNAQHFAVKSKTARNKGKETGHLASINACSEDCLTRKCSSFKELNRLEEFLL